MHIHPGSARSQPNQGFFMHPATLDGVPSSVLDDSPVRLVLGNCLAGTIHVLGATMIGWDAPLKIFAGMGRLQAEK